MNVQRSIVVEEGIAYVITKQEITKQQLESIKQNQLKQKASIEASIIEIDSKLPEVLDKEIIKDKEIKE